MKVLHVIDSMVRGGAESLILEHIRHAGPGVETMVCALNRAGPAMEEAQALGARTRVLGKGGRIAAGLSGLAALMREWHIEVVNGHNPTGALYATLAARAAGVPAVFRSEQSIHYPGRHSRAYPLIEAGLTVFTRRVLCVCDAALESHARRLGWARRKFVTVYPGISEAPPLPSRESLRAALGIAPDALAVISVGSLTRQKAQHVLIGHVVHVHDANLARQRHLVGAQHVGIDPGRRHLHLGHVALDETRDVRPE